MTASHIPNLWFVTGLIASGNVLMTENVFRELSRALRTSLLDLPALRTGTLKSLPRIFASGSR